VNAGNEKTRAANLNPEPSMHTDRPTRAHPAIHVAAVLVAVAVLLQGCGDDEEGSPNPASGPQTTGEVTKARYIEQGDAACARHNRKIQRDVQAYLSSAGQSSRAELAAKIVNRVLVPRMGHEIRTVRAFVLPPENVDRALGFLQAMQNVVDRAQKDPLAFTRAPQPFAEAERLGREFGFEVCGGL
jgi:hypothetical protein